MDWLAALNLDTMYLQYFLPLCRIGAMLMAMPILGAKLIPGKARLVIAVSLTIIVAPIVTVPDIEPFTLEMFIVVINQMLIGFCFGLVLQALFTAFVLGGQVIAMEMGLGFASMMDPQNGVSVPALGQFYLMVASLLFISLDSHLVAIGVLVDGFSTLPIGFETVYIESLTHFVGWGGWMFFSALKLAIPAVLILLVVQIGFGVVAKASPQINIFSLGFPISLIFGLFVLWLTIRNILPEFYSLQDQIITYIKQLSGLGV